MWSKDTCLQEPRKNKVCYGLYYFNLEDKRLKNKWKWLYSIYTHFIWKKHQELERLSNLFFQSSELNVANFFSDNIKNLLIDDNLLTKIISEFTEDCRIEIFNSIHKGSTLTKTWVKCLFKVLQEPIYCGNWAYSLVSGCFHPRIIVFSSSMPNHEITIA